MQLRLLNFQFPRTTDWRLRKKAEKIRRGVGTFLEQGERRMTISNHARAICALKTTNYKKYEIIATAQRYSCKIIRFLHSSV
jgi:hypothetical protein